jgi:hypothetical protein
MSKQFENDLWKLGQVVKDLEDCRASITEDQAVELLAASGRLSRMAMEKDLVHRPAVTEQEQATSETSVRAA